MSKNEYLKKIEKKLSILSKEEVEKVIQGINEQITAKMTEGQPEEEIIKELEPVEVVIEKTLKNHGINPESLSQKENSISKKFAKWFDSIHETVEIMSQNDFQSNLKIIMDILILIILICLIKIPFILVRYLGESFMQYLKMPILLDIWGIAIEFVYLIVAIMVFMNIFAKWFDGLKTNPKIKRTPKKEETPKMGEELSAISLSEEKEDKE